jgi:hypothetical protein
MVNDLITTLTDWIPWLWAQNLAVILLYMGILGALSIAPLLVWFAWVSAAPARRREQQ